MKTKSHLFSRWPTQTRTEARRLTVFRANRYHYRPILNLNVYLICIMEHKNKKYLQAVHKGVETLTDERQSPIITV